MTETTATETTATDVEQQNVNQQQDMPETPQASEADEQQDDKTKAGREAAKYRTRLRDTEAERDALREQLTALRRQVVEDASGLAKPSALWLSDLDANTLFSDDGRVDTGAMTTALARVADDMGLQQAPRTPRPDPSQGGGGSSSRAGATSWADVINSARR